MSSEWDIDLVIEIKLAGCCVVNKVDKLCCIMMVVCELFIEKGFDGIMMCDIVVCVGVGFGILFDYLLNKCDFLFLLFNLQFENVFDESVVVVVIELLFIDKLMVFFGGYYVLYVCDCVIVCVVLCELIFFSEGGEV